jgi:ribonucleotide monophosphatase NagD (HAD superfamily)
MQTEVLRPLYLLSPSAREEIDPTSEDNTGSDTPYDSVVVGLAPSLFTYEHLNTAFRILTGEQPSSLRSSSGASSDKPAPSLIANHKAKYIRSPDGALSLGPGPFVAALENASGVKAEVVGKPTRGFFETVIGSLGLADEPELGGSGSGSGSCTWVGKIAVIGDDFEADLGEGAVELGL